MSTYRLFPATNGPAAAVSYGGEFAAGVAFEVTSGGTWFEGYWWWVCESGAPTSPQTFALWQAYGEGNATLVSAATVTSGTLTPGQWNYIPLAQPIMLSIGGGANFAQNNGGGTAVYIACTGFTGGFPDSYGYGAGESYSGGITSGPLTAFSDHGGTAPAPWNIGQGLFSVNSAVTTAPPFGVSSSANFWMDVQVSDTAPDGYTGSYRMWPNFPLIPGGYSNDAGQQTTGTEFWLSETCTVDNIWFWSPPGAVNLPSRCAIFDISTQQVVAGSDNMAPAWLDPSGSAAKAGDGWVACSYASSALTLPAGKYKAAIYTSGGGIFYQEDVDYFGTGPGSNNIVNGPITVPNNANASSLIAGSDGDGDDIDVGDTVTGNSSYQDGPWAYPDTFDATDDGENRWVDVEVTPVAGQATPTPTPTVVATTPTPTPTPTPTQSTSPPVTNPGGFLPFL
jgi:hypothetical protein